ncbi:hypothetical protein RCOM_0832400 [Ricinus communis]|uniref:Reverse transcriptase zinc-binding domain-containing protein n=1 Tax=Ricinus communis TaxID=3988 RepID=B9SM13_RICCO|nr:hypothetical protein RCOM_0832400 [Ricinus communis]
MDLWELFFKPIYRQSELLEEVTVSMLIDMDTKRWKHDVVRSVFIPSDADQILQMPLSVQLTMNRMIWKGTKHGHFSVKSVYHLATQLASALETMHHVFFECALARGVWYASLIRLDFLCVQVQSFIMFLASILGGFPAQYVDIFYTIAWEICSQCNQVCFKQKQCTTVEVVSLASKRLSDIQRPRVNEVTTCPPNTEVSRWIPPPSRLRKLNTDATLYDDGIFELGFIVRDDFGEVLIAGTKRTSIVHISTPAEVMTIR